jgi:formamidopyrimidine-DNA glycosylase
MIELPEAVCLAKQFNETLKGKKIASVIAGQSPHKFAFYHGDPAGYDALMRGKTVGATVARAGLLETQVDDVVLLLGCVTLTFHAKDEKRPQKHHLLIEFEDGTAISSTVQLYGELYCFREGELQNPYYDIAKSRPSPLSDEFDRAYFDRLITSPDVQKLSAKAFLATEQRIPGLGNGVLQDILYNAGIHPKRKVATLTDGEKDALFHSVKSTLKEMTEQGGRDTEKDLFGRPGGYQTRLSQLTLAQPCPVCGGRIIKEPYLGGSIYYCDGCQKM